jgi:hypothetical protein
LYAIKNLKNLLIISLLCFVISCTNEQKKNELDASNNNMALNKASLDSTAQSDFNISKETPQNVDNNQEKEPKKVDYHWPDSMKLRAIAIEHILKVFDKKNINEQMMFFIKNIAETFRPIGWSKDGKFAFIVDGIGDGCGCPYMKLKIIDALSSDILFKIREIDDGPAGGAEYYWDNSFSEINKQLSKYKIIQSTNFELITNTQNVSLEMLKTHRVEKYINDDYVEAEFTKGSTGVLKDPYGNALVSVDYYFWYWAARGEGGTEFDVTGINNLDETKQKSVQHNLN